MLRNGTHEGYELAVKHPHSRGTGECPPEFLLQFEDPFSFDNLDFCKVVIDH